MKLSHLDDDDNNVRITLSYLSRNVQIEFFSLIH